MANSKVELSDGTVLMDLTSDTVSSDTLLSGTTAHDSAGNEVTGTVSVPTKVSELENDSGYITDDNQFWAVYGTTTYAEITEAVNAGKAIFCSYENKCYSYVGNIGSSGTIYYFACFFSATKYTITCDSADSWGITTLVLKTAPTTLSAALIAGDTSISFTNSKITSTALVDIYTSVWGVNPTAVTQSDTTLTITFPAQTQTITVRLVIS